MQVFRPSNIINTLFFIPRVEATSVILKITHELRSVETTININGAMVNGAFIGNFSYNFKEGASYQLEIFDTDLKLLCRDNGFATDVEDLQNYKLIR